MFIVNFFKELYAWRIVKKVYNEHKKEFNAVGIKSDWFGKLYKVINRKTDIELGSDEDAAFLHTDLAVVWATMVKYNIADILAYELKPLENEQEIDDNKIEYEHGYLVTFTPAWKLDKQYVTWKSVLFMLILIGALISVIIYLILCLSTGVLPNILTWISSQKI